MRLSELPERNKEVEEDISLLREFYKKTKCSKIDSIQQLSEEEILKLQIKEEERFLKTMMKILRKEGWILNPNDKIVNGILKMVERLEKLQ